MTRDNDLLAGLTMAGNLHRYLSRLVHYAQLMVFDDGDKYGFVIDTIGHC